EGTAMPWAYRRDAFVAVSPSTRGDLLELGVDRERLAVIHNGLDHDRFRPGAKDDRPTALWIGRLRRYKCVETVIDAAARWAQGHPDLRLLIAGDGPQRPALEQRVRSLGLGGRVELLGFVDHGRKVELLQRAHVVVQTSMKEGWGMTVIEANACGTAVVASDVAGLRDSVRDGETGVLVPWNRPDALAAAVTDRVDDGARRRRLEAASVHWARRFSWRRSAERWLELLDARRRGGIVPAALRLGTVPDETPS
ncbi:MAG: glycosyltransferase family 4 protein, partial [Acidobacteriota bacterium]